MSLVSELFTEKTYKKGEVILEQSVYSPTLKITREYFKNHDNSKFAEQIKSKKVSMRKHPAAVHMPKKQTPTASLHASLGEGKEKKSTKSQLSKSQTKARKPYASSMSDEKDNLSVRSGSLSDKKSMVVVEKREPTAGETQDTDVPKDGAPG